MLTEGTDAYLTQASNAQYYGVMYFEVKRFLFRLCRNPDDFSFAIEDMASKIMCQLTWDDASFSESYISSAWGLLTQMSPAGPITNVLTPLWHLPQFMNPWKRAERIRHDNQQALWMSKLLEVRAKMNKGEARWSFTKQYLDNPERTGLQGGDYEASSVIGMMALVGIFTVAGPMYYFLLAMVFHPEWMIRCQAEIDEVCEGKMPTLDDSPRLPVLRACILETLRWKPNVPTGKQSFARYKRIRLMSRQGVAHEVEADDFYHGIFIEKGTRILPLDWLVQHQLIPDTN
jgi:cytochrome P450